ncbi:MAG: type II toxin-antitoxin system HigB family toxin [Sphingobacteriales bacterium]|nr:MAG: type II toxin-antitoxin system HigB family toxin [Sphingobacteriales bacterium]
MMIHALKTLKLFWQNHPDAEIGLKYWYSKAEAGIFANPQQIVQVFKGADFVGNQRIVFNISKNKYRLIAALNYNYQLCFIKFIGTHKQYDNIDAKNNRI